MKLSIEEFHRELSEMLRKYLPAGEMELLEMNLLRFKGRIHIDLSVFIDVFYAARTKKVSFSIIRRRKRLYGIDNLDGWHCHPFGNPENHVPIDEPLIEGIVAQCTMVITELNKEDKRSRK